MTTEVEPAGAMSDESRARRLPSIVPAGLRARIAILFGAITLASVILASVVTGRLVRDGVQERETARLTLAARSIASEIAPLFGSTTGAGRMAPALARLAPVAGADIIAVGPAGETSAVDVTGSPAAIRLSNGPEIETARAGEERAAVRPGAAGAALVVAVPVPGRAGAAILLSEPIAAYDPFTPAFWRGAVAATILASFAAWVAGEWAAERIAAPLADLRRHAALVAAGRLGATVVPADTRELNEVGQAFNDMTRRLAAAMAERDRASGRLETTLANLTDGVVITDDRGVLLRFNPAAARMFGVLAHVARRPFVEVCRDHELAALLWQALDAPDDGVVHDTVDLVGPGRTLEVSAQRLDAGGERIGVMVLRDVTELRRLEGVRRDFVANVSHELRTPLTSIRALVETLEAGAIDDPEAAASFLDQIVHEIERLTALIDDLLDLARLESGRLDLARRPVDVAAIIEHAADRLRPQTERAGLALQVAAPVGAPTILADPDRIEQVLLNLMHNAIKFTPPGGRIVVSAAADDASVAISVRDTGVGIGAADLPRLFERFYKVDRARRSEGTGLGLAIAKHIVEAHGGAIRAESAPGQGATFTIVLPRANGGAGE